MNSDWSQGEMPLLAYEWKFLTVTEDITNDFSLRTWEGFIEMMKFELGLRE